MLEVRETRSRTPSDDHFAAVWRRRICDVLVRELRARRSQISRELAKSMKLWAEQLKYNGEPFGMGRLGGWHTDTALQK